MLVFPQLSTGASALYALSKLRVQRTVVNALADGRTDVFADPDAAQAMWEMRARGLTRSEWDAIESLFEQTAGGWKSFTFLDPAGNLLAWSEDFAGNAWALDPLMAPAAGIADPWGTARATRFTNSAQSTGSITQTLAAPADFQYCLSLWARSGAGSPISLRVGATTGTFALGPAWKRLTMPAHSGPAADTVACAVEIGAGAAMDLFGMQLEAQPAASPYKQTGARGGVYSNARFASDELTVTAQSTDVFDALIQIVSTEN
jgi:hypothetical protein